MRSAQITSPRTIKITDIPVPDVPEGMVRVRLTRAALCGSDYPYFSVTYKESSYPLPPGYPGHECMGVVDVSRAPEFAAGESVMYYPPDLDSYKEYHVTAPERLQKLPVGPEPNVLLMTQLLGAVSHAAFRIDRPYRRNVVVMGQGPVGLLFTALMRNFGAKQIITVDPLSWRREASSRMGADSSLDPRHDDVDEAVGRMTGGAMADIVIDAFGQDTAVINRCFDLARHNGQVAFFGICLEESPVLNFNVFFRKELRMIASVGPDLAVDYPFALDSILKGRIDVTPLLTHTMPFSDIQRAFEMAVARDDGAIKIVLDMEK